MRVGRAWPFTIHLYWLVGLGLLDSEICSAGLFRDLEALGGIGASRGPPRSAQCQGDLALSDRMRAGM